MNPEFPIYIPSKGRSKSRLTMKLFDALQVPYKVIVEEDEYSDYANVLGKKKLLVLDAKYQRDYDPYCELTDNESRGSGPARNFAWDHAVAKKHSHHWIVDDNIETLWRMNQNW